MKPSEHQSIPNASTLAPGQPGYRNRPGRTGLDPLENSQDQGYFIGLAIRGLFRRIRRLLFRR
ncbi:MAG TPA: hypothetical protein VGD58_11630 [Herpetosiphonaceae bacterium]